VRNFMRKVEATRGSGGKEEEKEKKKEWFQLGDKFEKAELARPYPKKRWYTSTQRPP